MKRTLQVFALLALVSSAFAFDLSSINQSDKAFVGAVDGLFDLSSSTAQYIPGYGLNLQVHTVFGDLKANDAATQLASILQALAPTIKGLDAGDWISIAYTDEGIGSSFELVIRIKPNVPNSLEVWLDGQKQ